MHCTRMADVCASNAATTDDRDEAQQHYATDGRRLCDGSLADRPFANRPQCCVGMLSSNLHFDFDRMTVHEVRDETYVR